MSEHGPTPRVHGNKGRRPKRSLNLADVQRAVYFLLNMAESIGISIQQPLETMTTSLLCFCHHTS
ncbi:hypothetical protein DPMN_084310 [Dreissena polymorpha]|uniref:Uncharacterized protein n=1 Tax=Dreissena polymorpha TaxID=45954 RepID=A0A9D4BBX1_DREPO|nr:hypothetical protein DPMN_084310 [Dreissena polymorpha]